MNNQEQVIKELFIRKGYFPNSPITKRELLCLLNSLLAYNINSTEPSSQTFFNQLLLNQLWTQTEQRIQKRKNNVKTIDVITTIVDAIQILANHLKQIQSQISVLNQNLLRQKQNINIVKQEKFNFQLSQKQKNYSQFQKDLHTLLKPFQIKFEQVAAVKRKQSIKKRNAFLYQAEMTVIEQYQDQPQKKNDQQWQKQAIQNMKNYLGLVVINGQQSSQDQFKCSRYFFIFLAVLELTVCLYKFNFVNILLLVLGFICFQNEIFKQKIIKITIGFEVFTIVLDIVWTVLYSHSYLNATVQNSPQLKHQLKAVFQYIWFITILQLMIKIILLYFLVQYYRTCQKNIQQKLSNLAQNHITIQN